MCIYRDAEILPRVNMMTCSLSSKQSVFNLCSSSIFDVNLPKRDKTALKLLGMKAIPLFSSEKNKTSSELRQKRDKQTACLFLQLNILTKLGTFFVISL